MLREATDEELRRAVRRGKLGAVPTRSSAENRAQRAPVRPLDVELPGEAEAREREIEEILEDVRRRLGRDIPVE